MRLCRFSAPDGSIQVGLSLDDTTVLDLSVYGKNSLEAILEESDPLRYLEALPEHSGRTFRLTDVQLLPPVERQEVWAAGVTYLRSRAARTEESEHDATAYDRVYDADRPELFFKASANKVMGSGQKVGIRKDSRWSVPEPELALVLNSRGELVGLTIGNDMSARDIEGDNLLYLPQAKIYKRSCALGPWITPGLSEERIRKGTIRLNITRGDATVFAGEAPVNNLKRPFENLIRHLYASQSFPHGAVLLTGTGIIPPDDFSLQAADRTRIEITELGVLENQVVEV